MNAEIIALSHNQIIYLETWQGIYADHTVQVSTLRGYCEEKGWDYQKELERCRTQNHEFAWTLHESVCLYGDRAQGQRAIERRRQARTTATLVSPDQLVSIEGALFKVRVNPGNLNKVYNSNPISFIPVNPQ